MITQHSLDIGTKQKQKKRTSEEYGLYNTYYPQIAQSPRFEEIRKFAVFLCVIFVCFSTFKSPLVQASSFKHEDQP